MGIMSPYLPALDQMAAYTQEGDTTPRRIEDIELGLPLLEQYGGLSLENHANANGSIQPLQNTLEAIANLIYLARHAKTHSAQQHRYLDWAARIIEELQHHPKVQE
jgi:hypothetical protein